MGALVFLPHGGFGMCGQDKGDIGYGHCVKLWGAGGSVLLFSWGRKVLVEWRGAK